MPFPKGQLWSAPARNIKEFSAITQSTSRQYIYKCSEEQRAGLYTGAHERQNGIQHSTSRPPSLLFFLTKERKKSPKFFVH